MTNNVVFANSSLIDRWIKVSVFLSTADVASSSNRSLGRERMARARHRSCFCPCDKFAPEEEIGDDKDKKIFVFSLFAGSVAVTEVAELPTAVVEDSAVRRSCSGTGVESAEGIRCTRCRASRT